jgi:hypothetical protein
MEVDVRAEEVADAGIFVELAVSGLRPSGGAGVVVP